MKANELMIGDWISIDEPDKYAGATGQIQSLMYHREGDAAYFHVFIQGKFGFVSREVCSDDIRPITLTPEILEKNGFVNDRGIYCWRDENKQITYFSKENNRPYCTYSFVNIESGCIVVDELPIEYVHELQHTLRLCGIKIEIEL